MTHDVELEAKLLAAILFNPDVMAEIENLRPMMFFDPRHQIVFTAILKMHRELKPIDVATVCNRLGDEKALDKIGGEPFIVGLSIMASSGAYAGYYAETIIKYYGLRRIGQIGVEMQGAIEKETEPDDLATSFIDKLSKIQIGISGDAISSCDRLAAETFSEISNNDRKGFIQSGYSYLDKFTGGIEKGTFTIVAARTRVGKSDFMVNLALNTSRSERVGIISLEMREKALMRRMIANIAGINRLDIRTGQLESHELDQLAKAATEITNRQIFITDKPGMTARDIKAKINLIQKKYGVSIVFVDHLHRIRFKGQGKTHDQRREVSEILADTARGFDVPIVCMAQLNRENARENKKPIIEQIRDAGEDDADVILMLWREKAYQYPSEDNMEILIGKDREGSSGVVYCHYDLTTGRIIQNDSNDKQTDENKPF